jgi:hypothetical protein
MPSIPCIALPVMPLIPLSHPCHVTHAECQESVKSASHAITARLSFPAHVLPRSEECVLLDSQEYSLTAWPARRLPPCALPMYPRAYVPLNMPRSDRAWESLFIHGHNSCSSEQASCPPSQSHNYKAAKDQCNPMNPLPRCRTMKAFTPSSSGYHAADPSAWQR